MEKSRTEIYARNTVEFVTVTVEFCAFLEQSAGKSRTEFVDTLLKILPLLYLKASLLPEPQPTMLFVEQAVSESDYNYIRNAASSVMGEFDDYLDVFVEDMKYSDTPIRKCISEDLADIYQDLRNFIEVYRQENEETMQIALSDVVENFQYYWGQTLVNTMRALHEVKYGLLTDKE